MVCSSFEAVFIPSLLLQCKYIIIENTLLLVIGVVGPRLSSIFVRGDLVCVCVSAFLGAHHTALCLKNHFIKGGNFFESLSDSWSSSISKI